ncbi:MAG: DNA alkylation repair protein [Candidatus Gallimonas sp.]
MTYEEALARLRAQADPEYRNFHKKLLKNEAIEVIGVRTPVLRRLAKEWRGDWETALSFPNEYYEIGFLKCALVAALPYEEFVRQADGAVSLLDNWATCDLFKARCIAAHREEFLPVLKRYLADEREFVRRYALVTLLNFYIDEPHLPLLFDCIAACGDGPYYVVTAAAWLTAEILARYYGEGKRFLAQTRLPVAAHNRAIRKAIESYRLTAAQKEELRAMKRK